MENKYFIANNIGTIGHIHEYEHGYAIELCGGVNLFKDICVYKAADSGMCKHKPISKINIADFILNSINEEEDGE